MQVRDLKDGDTLRVPLAMLVDAPWGNVRKGKRDPGKFDELRQSIRRQGVLQGITLRPNDDDNTLEVLAGYGRRIVAMEEGHEDIPAVIKRVDDKQGIAIGLSENLDRNDLSITDEIAISQRYVSLFDADYEEAAKLLGWSARKLKGRLKLNDCSEAVLAALREGNIKLGHAEVLCQFKPKLQEGTLKLVLDEGWSVDYLKERANKATRFLRHAKFDTSECDQCPHNSSVQAELFDNSIGESKCGHLPCYRSKSEAWIESRKAEMEAEDGKVFLNVEKPDADRNTVSAEIVGEDVFTEDCLACVNRVRILQDGVNKDCGTVIDNQCIDIGCFKNKSKAKHEDEQGRSTTTTKAKAGAAKKSGTNKSSRATLSAGMSEQARAFARKVIGTALLGSESYRLALTLQGLSDLTGYMPNGRHLSNRSESIAKLCALDADTLKAEIDKALHHGTLETSAAAGRMDATEAVLKSAGNVDAAKNKLVAAWSPSKEWLTTYQKGAIEGFCKQRGVGFATAYDETNGKGAFSKLVKKKKDEMIAEILAFSFDWSAIAPKELTDLVK